LELLERLFVTREKFKSKLWLCGVKRASISTVSTTTTTTTTVTATATTTRVTVKEATIQ